MMEGRGRGKARQCEEERKRPGEKTISSRTKPKMLPEEDEVGYNGHRYHQRELPPRFQQKQPKSSLKFNPKSSAAVTKKPSKEAPRWSEAHSPDNDGGWSTGVPAKGSGWTKNPEDNEWGQTKKSPTWGDGWEGSRTEADGTNNGHWSSDQEEGSSRSQSPGGLFMVVKQTTPIKDWESRPANWKMHTIDTKPDSDRDDKSHDEPANQKLGEASPSKDNATPPSDMWRSGRTSANSMASLSEVNGKVVKSGPSSRSASPRKMNKYEPTSSGSSNSLGRGLILPRPRKSIAELEGGLESLHSAPSGWGNPPSPKMDSIDKGTELWGFPPDDLARMGEGQPLINGWNGGSKSPHPKPQDYSADSASWPHDAPNKWPEQEDKMASHSEGPGFYDPSSRAITPSSGEAPLYSVEPPLTHSDGTYPPKQPSHNKWNSFDETNNTQSQLIQNQLMVKDLVVCYQQLVKLKIGQSSGNIQSLQKSLSQMLNQAQLVRQKLVTQLPSSGVPNSSPLKMQLSQTNEIITALKQHINQSQTVLSQQFPQRKMEPRESGELNYAMRDLSLRQGPPARSMSKLHRIISSQEDLTELPYSTPASTGYNSPSPFSPSFRSPATPSKPVHQIQEFKPGVPWQSRDAPKQTEHYYNPGVQRSTSFGQQPGSFAGPTPRYSSGQQRFVRSQSSDNSYYGNQSRDHPWSSASSDNRPQNFPGRGWNSGRPSRMSLPSTPVEQSSWRPSTLLPKQDYQYKQFERRLSRGTPIEHDWIPETPTNSDPVWGSEWPKGEAGWNEAGEGGKKWSDFSEWQHGGGRGKVRLGSSGAPLSPWLVVRTNGPQVNLMNLKDACKGYGDVKSFIEGANCVLVGYGSVEEALQAKSHVDSLWSGQANTEVIPEGEMENVWQSIKDTPKPPTSLYPLEAKPPTSLYPLEAKPPTSLYPLEAKPPTTLYPLEAGGGRGNVFQWEEPKPTRYSRQASTPGGSSVWSDGGFLSGISSPWSSDFSGTLTSPSTGYQSDDIIPTPDETGSNPGPSTLSTYLPNGLL